MESPPKKPTADLKNPWMLAAIGLALILIIVLAKDFVSPRASQDINPTDAGNQLVDFVNQTLAPQIGSTVSLQAVSETSGVYQVDVLVDNPPETQTAEQTLYITRDGKFLIPQIIDIAAVSTSQQIAPITP